MIGVVLDKKTIKSLIRAAVVFRVQLDQARVTAVDEPTRSGYASQIEELNKGIVTLIQAVELPERIGQRHV